MKVTAEIAGQNLNASSVLFKLAPRSGSNAPAR